jgi:uncharacterized protein with ParB-like and HNH nuclease domain
MNADAQPLLSIFEGKIRLEVPLFQRQYVWSQTQQWEPLWEDVSRKLLSTSKGIRKDRSTFLGQWSSIKSRPPSSMCLSGRS